MYEDTDIVVIEKPSGMISNRADTVKTETLQDWWDSKFKVKSLKSKAGGEDWEYFSERSGLVHRLDKETSGVMIMAKSVEAFVELLRQFKAREVIKTYLALTHGLWKSKEGIIDLPVGRMRHNRKMMGVREDGRSSMTKYQVLSEYVKWSFPKELKVIDKGYAGFSLVQFFPKTGRMHQIRVHSRQMGHPLVGDEVYAGRKRSREDRKWSKRVMLHAMSLELRHPVSHKKMRWESSGEVRTIADEFLC